ncbi:MAG TPA: trypsin-like peptidase domain-containing protein [Gaiellaceae bacterium]|nr:trypsin-like peptidase domain-containing protein [Gaiellaceae bacterium]
MLRRHIWWLAPVAGAAVAGAVVAAVSLGGGSSSNSAPTTSHARLKPAAAALAFQEAITAVVHELSPSVVQIQSPEGLGSGVVFDANGDIVTNNHVVAGGGPYAVTAGAHSYRASLVGRFAPDDLAVVHVAGAKLTPASFADSSKLDVGDVAIAIGNPLGLRSSVTDGIVSAFRQGVSEGNGVALPLMIQTSAAINPGNSGGALADLQGRVIGIPTLAATDPELGGTAAPGIGFAIPSNLVKDIATQIIRFGHVVNSHRAYLGVQIGDTNGAGVLVQSVSRGGPAAKAGLAPGDVITSVNGHKTATVDDLTSVVSELKPGTTVSLAVVTQRGARKTLHLTLGTFPGTA